MACYGFCSLSFCCGFSPSGLGYELSGFKAQGGGVKRVLCLQSASSATCTPGYYTMGILGQCPTTWELGFKGTAVDS